VGSEAVSSLRFSPGKWVRRISHSGFGYQKDHFVTAKTETINVRILVSMERMTTVMQVFEVENGHIGGWDFADLSRSEAS
jgi:hypothetical protein